MVEVPERKIGFLPIPPLNPRVARRSLTVLGVATLLYFAQDWVRANKEYSDTLNQTYPITVNYQDQEDAERTIDAIDKEIIKAIRARDYSTARNLRESNSYIASENNATTYASIIRDRDILGKQLYQQDHGGLFSRYNLRVGAFMGGLLCFITRRSIKV